MNCIQLDTRLGSQTLLLSTVLLAALGGPAEASSNSLFTIGASAGVGLRHDPGQTLGLDSLAPELGLRLRLVRFLGVEAEVLPRLGESESGESFGLRLSGLVYVVPTEHFGLYVKAGVSHSDALRLADDFGAWEELYLGGGVEVYLGERVALSAEALVRTAGSSARELLDEPRRLLAAFDPSRLAVSVAIRIYL